MKRSNKLFIAGMCLLSVIFLASCNKDVRDKTTAQSSSIDNSTEVTNPIAQWAFDSLWTEVKQHLKGKNHGARFSSTANAYAGKAAFTSPDSGFVSYDDAGTALPNLTTGLTVDFWLYAYPKTGGAQSVWCLPQTGQFWPTQHVLLDGYNTAQKDSGLIKVMFKANRDIPYNEEWQVYGGIPKFYRRWTHVQYAYNGSTSKFTLIVNGKTIADHVVLYTDDPNNGGV
ncbi:MAG: hypothetical protein ACXVPU_19685, partial [Bacteroidia bacterium]